MFQIVYCVIIHYPSISPLILY